MPRILIVEDDAATAWALEEGLSDEGYEIVAVDSAEKALAAFKQRPADLVITDLRLPRMDGATLVRRLRARGKPTAFLVVTAYGTEEAMRALLLEGVHACFPKPFQMERLRKGVEAALKVKVA